MKDNNLNILNKISLVYLAIPILMFFIGWCKLIFSIPLSIALIYGVYSFCKRHKTNYKIKINKKIILILIFAFLFVYVSGIGGYVFQNSDHAYRNAIFELLVKSDWPVIINDANSFNTSIGLVYYFAFWLPGALVGKIFGLTAAYLALFIWSFVGISLVFGYIVNLSKKHKMIWILAFIFFSGLDILNIFLHGNNVLDIINTTQHIEWTTKFQFSSFTTQLFWVFNQCIPAWIFTFLLIKQKSNRYLGFIFALSLLFCTLPSISLAFIVLYKAFIDNFSKFKLKEIMKSNWFKDTFTIENILCGIPILLVLAIFVKSNMAGSSIAIINIKNNLLQILVTLFCEVFIFYGLIYKYQKNNKLYYLSLLILMICPFISVNGGGDFCMRVSIPALVVLFMLIMDSTEKASAKKDKTYLKALIIILLIGAVTPLNEMKRTIASTTPESHRDTVNLTTAHGNANFFGKTDKNIFFKYIVK